MLRLLTFGAFGLFLLGVAASGFTGVADATTPTQSAAEGSAYGSPPSVPAVQPAR